ncbi:hypothetical protein MLD38_020815 [Melastoma candidum]|uniref:Uncharacterized protein n=1 Tax=Melastoma candidum TaxID=119954 RepID=A0ACB9QH32_9MYRT|nr:hypothetical protein MLD38_020815 [Melastoma candidum]
MQRQSIGGSPSSRLPQPPPSSSFSPSLHLPHNRDIDLLDDEKAAKSPSKPRRFSTSSSSSLLSPPSPSSPLPQHQRFVHAIPLLTLLCFLVLFLFSHDPSPSDLAQFKGFKRDSDIIGPGDGADGGRGGFRVGEVVGVSWRNLQESNKSRINRKFADF